MEPPSNSPPADAYQNATGLIWEAKFPSVKPGWYQLSSNKSNSLRPCTPKFKFYVAAALSDFATICRQQTSKKRLLDYDAVSLTL